LKNKIDIKKGVELWTQRILQKNILKDVRRD
jgi:hypothetical protein